MKTPMGSEEPLSNVSFLPINIVNGGPLVSPFFFGRKNEFYQHASISRIDNNVHCQKGRVECARLTVGSRPRCSIVDIMVSIRKSTHCSSSRQNRSASKSKRPISECSHSLARARERSRDDRDSRTTEDGVCECCGITVLCDGKAPASADEEHPRKDDGENDSLHCLWDV